MFYFEFYVFSMRPNDNLNPICSVSLRDAGESSVYVLKSERPSKGTVHFDCDVDMDQQQQTQQVNAGNESNDFDSKSID